MIFEYPEIDLFRQIDRLVPQLYERHEIIHYDIKFQYVVGREHCQTLRPWKLCVDV